jgi:hypothetical protein
MNKGYHSPALPKTDAENQKPQSTPSGFKKLASHPLYASVSAYTPNTFHQTHLTLSLLIVLNSYPQYISQRHSQLIYNPTNLAMYRDEVSVCQKNYI